MQLSFVPEVTTTDNRPPKKGRKVEDYVTLAEAAALVGVDTSTLRHAIMLEPEHQNHLKARKFGRDWFVRRADVIAWSERPRGKGGRPRKLGT